MIALSVSDQGADADNRVVDELWKLVADGFADFVVRLADEIIRGCEAAKIGHGLQVPDDGAWFHGIKAWHRAGASKRSWTVADARQMIAGMV